MRVKIAAALKQPGKVFEAALEEQLPVQEYAGRKVLFVSPAQLAFTYAYDGKTVALEGQSHVAIRTHCALCDEPFTEEITIPFQEHFRKDANTEDDSYAFLGEELELTKMVLDNIFLNIPLKSVCRADCKGLCPVCSCNLNTTRCACTAEEIAKASPLGALGQLLDEDKEV